MFDPQTIQSIKELLPTQQKCVVMFAPNAAMDVQAAALALALGLKELGKQVRVVVSLSEKTQTPKSLMGAELITHDLANETLLIEFPVVDGQVDKVSCATNEEKTRFSVYIQPHQGFAPIDSSQVTYSYAGVDIDVAFLVGVSQLEDLGLLYQQNTDVFTQNTVISVAPFVPEFGNYKLNTASVSSVSEGVLKFLEELQVTLTEAIATNIVSGIEVATHGFSSPTMQASTFTLVGSLLEAGGRRLRLKDHVLHGVSGGVIPIGEKVSAGVVKDGPVNFAKALNKTHIQLPVRHE